MKSFLLTGLFMIVPLMLKGQSRDFDPVEYQEIFESILSIQNEEVNIEEVHDNLYQLYCNPVNINLADREELNALLFLSFPQIDSLISYREKHGHFLSLEELYYIDGFSPSVVRMLTPFLTIESIRERKKAGLNHWLRESSKSLLTRYSRQLEKPNGYYSFPGKNNRYLGNPDHFTARFKLSIPDEISMGFSLDKDPGEPLIWAPGRNYYGFDHYSYHLAISNRGSLRNWVIGDYKILFGQGLVLGNGFYLGKSSETIASVRKKASGITPYYGSGESGFFRGSAAEFRFKRIDAAAFISYKKIDSRIEEDKNGNDPDWVIRSLDISGLHRTMNEIERRKNVRETILGYHFNYKNSKQNFSIGTTAAYTSFNIPYREIPDYYNQFDFQGTQLLTTGMDYNYYNRKFNLFGEVAVSGNKGWGVVNGIIGNLSKNIETAIHVRYYSPLFHSFYSNPFREASRTGNEEGIYWALKILPIRNIILNIYFDGYRFPWLKYNLRSPSSGNELFFKILMNPGKDFEFYGQFLQKIADASIPDSVPGIDGLLPGTKRQYWLQASWLLATRLQLRSRVQYSTYTISDGTTRGMAAFLDMGYNLNHCSISGRLAWFNSDNYLNRQYIFEQGALYDYEVPAFSGNGVRFYALIQSKINRTIHCWAKLGRTLYSQGNEIGTGSETIIGNHKTEFILQAEVKF